MWYVILGEAIAIAVLWGAWLHKKTVLAATEVALKSEKTSHSMLRTALVMTETRRAEEVEHLKTELVETRKALDALSTPDAVRSDIDRLFTR